MDDKQAALIVMLRQLRLQLNEASSLDAAVADEVRAFVHEIEATLAPNQKRPGDERMPLTDRLRQATLDFESAHPTLSQTVGNIADTLAQMGI